MLEGYDVEKLLSEDDIETYLSSLTDDQVKNLISSTDSSHIPAMYDMIRVSLDDNPINAGLTSILHLVLDEANTRGLLESSM